MTLMRVCQELSKFELLEKMLSGLHHPGRPTLQAYLHQVIRNHYSDFEWPRKHHRTYASVSDWSFTM